MPVEHARFEVPLIWGFLIGGVDRHFQSIQYT